MAGLSIGSQSGDEHFSHDSSKVRKSSGKVCQVCGGEIVYNRDGELFVACHKCGFPVCEACYEYQRSEGSQCCPQCNACYIKLPKRCTRLAGHVDADYEFQTKNGDDASRSVRQDDANHLENGGCDAEWRERVEKWKAKQEKMSSISKDEVKDGRCEDDDGYLYAMFSLFSSFH